MTAHNHDHHHNHDHNHDHAEQLSFEDKLKTLFAHWIDHNNSHLQTYSSWAKKADEANLHEVAKDLSAAAKIAGQITQKLEDALNKLKD
ncbi:MAG: zinc transporter [Desulfobacteraceae bacterium]|nr:zinc transporter [Desulfobacteraceae bacterium]